MAAPIQGIQEFGRSLRVFSSMLISPSLLGMALLESTCRCENNAIRCLRAFMKQAHALTGAYPSSTSGSPSTNSTLTMITETKPIERNGWRSTSVTRIRNPTPLFMRRSKWLRRTEDA